MQRAIRLEKSNAAAEDRRRSDRRPHVVEAWICSPTSSDPEDRVEVLAVNVSRHGVGFESDTPIAPGTFHTMEIGIGEQTMRHEVRVSFCRKTEHGRYDVGAEFC
ncbi:MAG TPA: PilZ domain-containing protein [Tepidisphaeraceae bacterium]|nr:PilZ domain-containing protein [Tepidisphaeraceae bacterium]